MEIKDNLPKDFIFEPHHLCSMYLDLRKENATKMIWRLKQKLKKPSGSVLLASEYCDLKGITLVQLYRTLAIGA